MKKMMLGLAAVFAMSVAVPAYASDAAPEGAEKAKPAKKGKKDKKEAEKPADEAKK